MTGFHILLHTVSFLSLHFEVCSETEPIQYYSFLTVYNKHESYICGDEIFFKKCPYPCIKHHLHFHGHCPLLVTYFSLLSTVMPYVGRVCIHVSLTSVCIRVSLTSIFTFTKRLHYNLLLWYKNMFSDWTVMLGRKMNYFKSSTECNLWLSTECRW